MFVLHFHILMKSTALTCMFCYIPAEIQIIAPKQDENSSQSIS